MEYYFLFVVILTIYTSICMRACMGALTIGDLILNAIISAIPVVNLCYAVYATFKTLGSDFLKRFFNFRIL